MHGLQLEGLRSFGRYVTDADVARKRERADDLRQHPEKLASLIATAMEAGETPETTSHSGVRRIGPWAAAGAGAIVLVAAWMLLKRMGRMGLAEEEHDQGEP
jgi:hypothetical protein